MSALTVYIIKQAQRTTSDTRRLRAIMVLMFVIAGAGLLLLARATPQAVVYGTTRVIVPTPAALCPGESFTYEQAIQVQQTAMVTVSRDWCNRGFTCHLELHESWPNVVLTPLTFNGPVTRTVPVSSFFKPGGLYEFRSGVKNGELSVQIVQFSIRDDCEAQP